MRILICGDRFWADYDMIREFVFSLPEGTVLIEGEAKGADKMSAKAFTERGWGDSILRFPADWEGQGISAGPRRNIKQLKEGDPDIVIGYHNNVKNSKGTNHMLSISIKAGKPTYLNVKSFDDIILGLTDELKITDLK